jgi:carboxyl-terminal processing protease
VIGGRLGDAKTAVFFINLWFWVVGLRTFPAMKRFILTLGFIIAVFSTVLAQFNAPLNPGIDPFSIKSGSTFSASGGSPNFRKESGKTNSNPSLIASDLREAEKIISRNYAGPGAANASELTKRALNGMLRSLDPHSNFYDVGEWKDLLDEQRSGYTGIGATISNFEIAGVTDTFILSTFPGSPAAKVELRFGDKIVAINGEKMTGKSSDIVRDKLRGESGTILRLTIEHSATNRIETVEIRRNRVPQPSIPDAYILRPSVGYIDLSEGFNYTTSDEFDTVMHQLKAQGMRSLILDLRGNGGGIVDQAVKVAEKFLSAGTLILTQRGRARVDNRIWRSTSVIPNQMPLVVLVNKDTASASEIVAGAFQDDDRGMIVGEKTFGKGLVQSVLELPGKTGLTLTTARYLTPSGRSIQRDYTNVDIYDYFNHTDQAAGIDKPYFEARTTTNRSVLGGDGIQPDEVVKSDKLNETQASLLDPLFFFTRALVNGRIAGQEQHREVSFAFGKRIAAGGLAVSETLLVSFNDSVEKQMAGEFSPARLKKESAFIKLRLRYYLVMASFGPVSANRVLIEDDPQVAKAVETLPRAAQLAHLAAKARQNVIQ